MPRENNAGRWHWRREFHAAADKVPVFWVLDFNWAPIRIYVYLTICTINSDVGKARLGEERPQRNCYIFQRVPFISISITYFLEHLIIAVVRILNVH
jgi:hypothetical protein